MRGIASRSKDDGAILWVLAGNTLVVFKKDHMRPDSLSFVDRPRDLIEYR
jgi:hypothetical protein